MPEIRAEMGLSNGRFEARKIGRAQSAVLEMSLGNPGCRRLMEKDRRTGSRFGGP